MIQREEVNMTHAVPFDTLAYAKKLEARGVEAKHAEAHAEVLAEVLEVGFISKQESNNAVANLSQEIKNLGHELRTEIAAIRSELKTEIAAVRSELKTEIAAVKSEMIKWVFGISFAQAALIISVLKFFH